MSERAEYHANMFRFVEGAFSDLRHAASEWDSLDYFDQDDVLNGIADAGRCVSNLMGELEDGYLSPEDRSRLARLREELKHADKLVQDLEGKMKPPPSREEYEAMAAAQQVVAQQKEDTAA